MADTFRFCVRICNVRAAPHPRPLKLLSDLLVRFACSARALPIQIDPASRVRVSLRVHQKRPTLSSVFRDGSFARGSAKNLRMRLRIWSGTERWYVKFPKSAVVAE